MLQSSLSSKRSDYAHLQLVLIVMALMFSGLSTKALASEDAIISAISDVMTGSSSSGNDQVWFRVSGQPSGGSANCIYQNWSLFFIPDDTQISRDRAMSLLLTAQATGRPVHIQYEIQAVGSDFWGFGISKCVVRRIGLGN